MVVIGAVLMAVMGINVGWIPWFTKFYFILVTLFPFQLKQEVIGSTQQPHPSYSSLFIISCKLWTITVTARFNEISWFLLTPEPKKRELFSSSTCTQLSLPGPQLKTTSGKAVEIDLLLFTHRALVPVDASLEMDLTAGEGPFRILCCWMLPMSCFLQSVHSASFTVSFLLF